MVILKLTGVKVLPLNTNRQGFYMSDKIKIDIISDVVCPWCIIGYKNLTQAISELGVQDHVVIEWQPFELNPDMPPEGEELREHSARKYGSTRESSELFRSDMVKRGQEVGFVFDFDENMKIVNTLDAHILLEYARGFNLQTELQLRLFAAYFSEHKDISDHQVLVNEVASVGLDANLAMSQLKHTAAVEALQQKESEWRRVGVTSVPTVVINRTSALSGAHSVESFKQMLASALHHKMIM